MAKRDKLEATIARPGLAPVAAPPSKVTKVAEADGSPVKSASTAPDIKPGASATTAGLADFAAAAPPPEAPREQPSRSAAPPDAPAKRRTSTDAADKVTGLAEEFHEDQDDEMPPERSAAAVAREAAMKGSAHVSEEDRRRALLSERTGVDLFPRDENGRPDEPTLAECNRQFFAEEDHRRRRRAELKDKVGDVLIEAFGKDGAKRLQKNLR